MQETDLFNRKASLARRKSLPPKITTVKKQSALTHDHYYITKLRLVKNYFSSLLFSTTKLPHSTLTARQGNSVSIWNTPILLLRMIGSDVAFTATGMFASGCVGTLTAVYYLVLGNMVDSLSPKTHIPLSNSPIVRLAALTIGAAEFKTNINTLVLQMVMIAVFSYIANWTSSFCLNMAYDRIGDRIKYAYFSSMLKQEIAYFDQKTSGGILGVLTESCWKIQEAYSFKLAALAEVLCQVVIGVGISLYNGWKLALIMLATFPLVCLTLCLTTILTRHFVKRTTGHSITLSSIIYEALINIRTVRTLNGEGQEERKLKSQISKFSPVYLKKASILATSYGSSSFILWGVIAVAFWFGGRLVMDGEMTVGGLFQVFAFMIVTIVGMSSFLTVVIDFIKINMASQDLLKATHRVPEVPFSAPIKPEVMKGDLEFKNVDFVYPTRPTVPVLQDFNLWIPSGKTIAFVGSSGSGKSTLFNLITRLYCPSRGCIVLDGTDMADIDPQWLHQKVGIVSQEPTLFTTTIRENILYGLPESRIVTDKELQDICTAAKAHDFIMQLPNGYHSMVGERGVSLSGGQRQRIAIARAMVRDPALLLLDEATSALDTCSEHLVQEALATLMKGRTCIIVAHRLSSVINADEICVLSNGQIVERGRHSDLIKIPHGHYAALVQNQAIKQ